LGNTGSLWGFIFDHRDLYFKVAKVRRTEGFLRNKIAAKAQSHKEELKLCAFAPSWQKLISCLWL